jgi:TRAP-type C4-dicarboxylate transport system permease small subunit
MLRLLARIEFAIAGLLLAAIVLLVFVAAIMRSFGSPVIWSVDMAQLLFIWLCMFGAARALREKGHLGIDLLVRFLPHRFRLGLEIVLSLVMLAFLGLLAYEGVRLALSNVQRQFADSGISYAWVTIAVPVGCVMLGAGIVFNIVEAWRKRRDGASLVYSRADAEAANIVTEL